MRTTYMARPRDIERKWYIIDAQGKALGRVASEVARILRGKHKVIFTPHLDTGDHVIVINAGKAVLTGKKLLQKKYYRHSGYPGGLKAVSYGDLMRRDPEKAMYLAVKGMMPHNRLGRAALKKLRVYRDEQHAQEAQKPEAWQWDDRALESRG